MRILVSPKIIITELILIENILDELELFKTLDKTMVLQEAKVFNESPIRPKQCRFILSKILYLLNTGESFSTKEATELFFAITKLFLSKDVSFLD
jgi:coatomer protein complex subunit gamma